MIKFRQKEFFAPLAAIGAGLGAMATPVMVGASVYGIKQGNDSQKEQERANEEQANLMKKQNQALLDLAKQNPQQAVQAQGIKQNQFSVMANMKGLGKDLFHMAKSDGAKKLVAGSIIAGTGMAASGYLADRAIQWDIKRRGESLPGKQPQQGSVMQQQYSNKEKAFAFTPEELQRIRESKGKPTQWGSWFKKEVSNQLNPFSKAGAAALGIGAGITILPYAISRIGKKKVEDNTQTTVSAGPPPPMQQQYSSIMKQKEYAVLPSAQGKSLLHFGRKATHWIGNLATMGFGGVKNMTKLGNTMTQPGRSAWTQKAGEWIKNNPYAATWATLVPGAWAASKTFDIGSKVVEKPLKAVDKNAFAYQDSQNQEVENN